MATITRRPFQLCVDTWGGIHDEAERAPRSSKVPYFKDIIKIHGGNTRRRDEMADLNLPCCLPTSSVGRMGSPTDRAGRLR